MASLFDEINKLQPSHVIDAVGAVLSVVAPGFLIVLHYWPQLFHSLDDVKLFFLAISLSLPVLATNSLVVIGSVINKNNVRVLFSLAMYFSFVMLYGCLFVAWSLKLSFSKFVVLIIALELCGILVSIFIYSRAVKKTANKTTKI